MFADLYMEDNVFDMHAHASVCILLTAEVLSPNADNAGKDSYMLWLAKLKYYHYSALF